MLPPGIFLWDSDTNDVLPTTIQAQIAASHSLWEADMESHAPWKPAEDVSGLAGAVLKSATQIDAPIVLTYRCSTTMEVARGLLEKGELGDWGAVLAVEQSSGRGQLRRPWVSPAGNLHASIILPLPPADGEWAKALRALLPLVVGHLIAEVLEELGTRLEIKWPNDLLINGRKAGGMLIEEKNDMVILGLGLNLAEFPSDELMREDSSVSAAKLEIPNLKGGPLTLLELLVNRGKTVYTILLDELVPTQFISVVTKRLAWMNQTILVREGGQPPYEAKIMGLSQGGGLVLRSGGKETILISGSIFPL